MPLNLGDHLSSRSLLVGWQKYHDEQFKIEQDTRVDQAAMEWLIAGSVLDFAVRIGDGHFAS